MSIFRDTFSEKVRDQLITRGKAFKKRSSNDIIYINGRTAWVRMVSGVDVEGFGDTLAKKNILQGGLLQNDSKSLRSGIGSNKAYDTNTDGLFGPESNLYGLRPMPGITNLDVSSRSAYGSIRVASVTFNCWDIKQLELMETLYMRPGFMVLVEWGWLPYLDNNGNIKSNVDFYDMFDTKTNKPLTERLIDVYNQSKKADANYEGILGYIKNYEWSARPDGGYECRTEIISTGEILESLKVNYGTTFLPTSELKQGLMTRGKLGNINSINNEQTTYIENLYNTNIVSGIAGELIFILYNYMNNNKTDWSNGKSYNFFDKDAKLTGDKNSYISMFGIDISKDDDSDLVNGIDPSKQVYINLEAFVNIINKWVIPVDRINKKPIVPLSTKSRTYTDNNKDESLLCLYHPLQISVDPSICLIKTNKIKAIKNISIDTTPLSSIFIPDKVYPNDLSKQRYSFFIKNWMKNLITGISTTEVRNRSNYIITSINGVLEVANKRGINKKDATEIISNTWEEYKYLNVSIDNSKINSTDVTRGLTQGATNNLPNSQYVILSPNNEILIGKNTVDDISKIGFKDYIKSINSDLNAVLGNDSSLFYISSLSPNISSLSESSIKSKISSIEAENSKNQLEFSSIAFLEKLGLEYEKEGFGVIGNIYINLNNIINLSTDNSLEGNDVKEKREINLYDFLKKLVNQIQGSIGSVNNFDIHVDPIDGTARIIDINYVEKDRTQAYKNAFTFISNEPMTSNPKLDALNNNVRSYKFSSQIFKEQSSIVAISAQNGGGIMGLDNETLVGYQTGLTNRLLPDSNPFASFDYAGKEIEKNKLISNINSSLNTFVTFLKDMNWIEDNFLFFDKTRKYKIENAEKYKNQLRDFIATYQSITKTESSFRSIIPTVLSLEIDGIGGLVIGHMFKLPLDLLPAGYKSTGYGRKQGYIITKIGHKVSNSDWVTVIDAQTVILEESNNPKFDLDKAISEALKGSKVKINLDENQEVKEPIPSNNVNEYYVKVLEKLNAPLTEGNILFLKGWRQAEGGKAKWNALNTTLNKSNSTNFNSVGVKNYPSLEVGTQATVDTLIFGGEKYINIIRALRKGLSNQKEALDLAINLQKSKQDLFNWVLGPNSTQPELKNYLVSVLKGTVRDIPIYT